MSVNYKNQARGRNNKKGLWMYCVTPARAGTIKRILGIQPGTNAYLLLLRDIEIAVSDVDIDQFNEKKIKEKLETDSKWAEKSVRIHHNAIAKFGGKGTVIPMKFGTIFKTKKGLEVMLKKYYREFKQLFTKLENKQEWGVKIYLEYKKFIDFLKKKNKEVKKIEKRKSAMPEGMKWYADRKTDEILAAHLEDEIEKELQRAVKGLEEHCEQIVLCNLLPKEATGDQDNIFNAACLVVSDKLGAFKKSLQNLEKEYVQIGAVLKATGPWPPYNFVEFENEKN